MGFEGGGGTVWEYVSQYVIYSQQSGLDVEIRPLALKSSLGLHGPKSAEMLVTALGGGAEIREVGDIIKAERGWKRDGLEEGEEDEVEDSEEEEEEDLQLPLETLLKMPNLSVVEAQVGNLKFLIQRGPAFSGLDGFNLHFLEDFQGTPPFLRSFLRSMAIAGGRPLGLEALDMLRMEAGLPRPGVDVSPLVSPVSASMVWALDQQKMRLHLMFGWKRLFAQLAQGPTYRRVGLVLGNYAHAGCKLVSSPHRRIIGEITSCAWNPLLKRRVCQAYVKPEYAKHGKPVLANVLLDIPEYVTPKFKRRLIRFGGTRAIFRRLVACKVVNFPFVSLGELMREEVPFGEEERVEKKRGGRRFNPMSVSKEDSNEPKLELLNFRGKGGERLSAWKEEEMGEGVERKVEG